MLTSFRAVRLGPVPSEENVVGIPPPDPEAA